MPARLVSSGSSFSMFPPLPSAWSGLLQAPSVDFQDSGSLFHHDPEHRGAVLPGTFESLYPVAFR